MVLIQRNLLIWVHIKCTDFGKLSFVVCAAFETKVTGPDAVCVSEL